MGKLHRAKHFSFGKLICFGFNHHHGVFCAGNNKVQTLLRLQTQVMHVVDFWVQDVLAINKTNAASGDWAHERRARNCQRSRSRNHRNHVWIVDQVVRQNCTHNKDFVLKAGDEQRADWTVNQAGCQRLFFSWTRFTLEEATWYFTGSVILFLVVHCQGKEVLTWLLGTCECHVGHNAGFAQRGNDRTVSLTGNLACFQRKRLFAPLD